MTARHGTGRRGCWRSCGGTARRRRSSGSASGRRLLADLVAQTADEGHEQGNHTWAHEDLTQHGEAFDLATLQRTHELLAKLTGRAPTLCRPPYGRVDSVGLAVCASLHYGVTLWSQHVTGSNPQGDVDTDLRQASPGSIVLAHDGGPEPNAGLMKQLDRLVDVHDRRRIQVRDGQRPACRPGARMNAAARHGEAGRQPAEDGEVRGAPRHRWIVRRAGQGSAAVCTAVMLAVIVAVGTGPTAGPEIPGLTVAGIAQDPCHPQVALPVKPTSYGSLRAGQQRADHDARHLRRARRGRAADRGRVRLRGGGHAGWPELAERRPGSGRNGDAAVHGRPGPARPATGGAAGRRRHGRLALWLGVRLAA